jgi:hypothetical protein
MDIIKILYELDNIYSRRGVGHTSLMMNGLRNSKEAVVIASNQRYAKELSFSCRGNIIPVSLDNLEMLRGNNFPIAMDNSTIIQIIREICSYVGSLWKENHELNAVNMALRSELNVYKYPLDARVKYTWKEKISKIVEIIRD